MVKIKIDLKRRENLRRLHTATHILNYSARKVLGSHVWQNGSNLKEEYGTLDITHYNNLTNKEIFEIEKLVNNIIFENKKVKIEELERTEAEKKYGFILYQGGAIPMKTLRIVSIEDNDIEACGGIHMYETGGIGLFKIVETNKIQDGVIRIKFVVRDFALEYINKKENILKKINEIFNVDNSSIIRTSEKFFNEWKEQKKEIERLKKELKEHIISKILNSNSNEFKINDYDMGFIMEIFTRILPGKKKFKLNSNKFIIATNNFEINNYKKIIDKKKFKIYIL